MKKSQWRYHQIVDLTNIKQNLPRLLLMAGWLLVLVAVLGISSLHQLVSTPQDNRSQATNPEGRVTIRFVANSSRVGSGQNLVFTGYINTNSVPTDGAQLVLLLPKSSMMSPPSMSLLANSGLQVAFNQVVDRGDVYELQFVALPQTIGQSFTTTTEVPFMRIEGIANLAGSYQLSADLTRCFVTKYKSNPVVDELAPIMSVNFTIMDVHPLPTASPTPTTPVPPPTITPTPPISDNSNTLSLAFQLQGLTQPNQALEGIVYLQNNSNILDDNQAEVVFAEYEIPTKLISGRNGVLSPMERIRLNQVPIAPGGTSYDLLIKTPFSLRKKLGSLKLQPGPNIAPTNWAKQQLKTGDFWQNPRAEWNVLNLRDITQMLTVYTQLQVPVNEANRKFDVNFDQIIDIIDVAIVLSNYTAIEVKGD